MLFDRPVTSACATASDVVFDAVKELKDECSGEGNATYPVAERSISMASGPSTLAFRPKDPQPVTSTGFETDSSSDDEGFSIVHRPKPLTITTPDDPMSSPEVVPSKPIDVLALTGSDYPDDDEWIML